METKVKGNWLVFDTETIGLHNRSIFDFGYVINMKGEVVKKGRILIEEVYDNKLLLNRAHFYKKSVYDPIEKEEETQILSMALLRKEINSLIKSYNIDYLAAYNLKFDLSALNFSLQKYASQTGINKSKLKKAGIELVDIIDIVFLNINVQDYVDFCLSNNYVTAAGNTRYTVEHVYRYLTKDLTKSEPHTALEDAIIENYILTKVLNIKEEPVIGKIEGTPTSIMKKYR